MYSLYKDFTNEKLSLAYFGVFNDQITKMLIDLCADSVSKTKHLSKLSRKASFLVAESFQNIIKHGIIEKDNISVIQYSKDFFQISILEDRVVISSANVIEDSNVDKLNKNIDYINSLNSDELRNYKKERLVKGTLSEKGGAGLGLIEMVRKSGLPLKKHFISLTEGYSLVILNIEVPILNDLGEHKVDIDRIGKLYKRLVEDGILMIYKGDFSSTSNSYLIDMLNNNFIKDNKISSNNIKKIIAIIEVLQNVSKHGKKIDGSIKGIFALSLIDNDLYIECGNFVKREDYNELKKNLETIKSGSIDDIEKMYAEKMAVLYMSDNDNAGIGMLEIARFTKNTFTYSFIETPEKEIFYTMKIKTV